MTLMRRISLIILTITVVSWQSFGVAVAAFDPTAVGPKTETGPKAPTGPKTTPGPKTVTGPKTATGPKTETGPKDQITTEAAAASTPTTADPSAPAVNSEISNTGENSHNEVDLDQNTDVQVDQNNTANTTNNINVAASTGDNRASSNTGNGTAISGDVNGQITVINVANGSVAEGSTLSSQAINGDQTNDVVFGNTAARTLQTGANSNNVQQIDQNNLYQLNVNNEANTVNDINVEANTGNNRASSNTGNGHVESGDVNLAVNVINLLNTISPIDLKVLSVFGDVIGNLLVDIADTGNDSNNEISVDQNNQTVVNNTNSANAVNNINYDLNTGNNRANNNTRGGTVQSGSVNATSSVSTIANQPLMYYIVNVYGGCECSVADLGPYAYLNVVPGPTEIEISGTGNGSNNQTDINQNNSTEVNQTNNANVVNNINIKADTGNNRANDNTGSGFVSSGDINVMTSIANVMNASATAGQRFVLGVINIFGNWRGKAQNAANNVANNAPAAQSNQNNNSNSDTNAKQFASLPRREELPRVSGAQASNENTSNGNSGNSTQTTKSGNTTKIKNTSTIKNGGTDGGNFTVNTNNTVVSSPQPSATPTQNSRENTRPKNRFFATIAHAAEKSGLTAGENMPMVAMLAIPAGLWLLSELLFSRLIRRRQNKTQA